MDKFFNALKKPARIIVLVMVGVYAMFELLYAIGTMADGDGGDIGGGLFFLLFFSALVAALFVAILMKKESAAKLIGFACFGYLAIRTIYSFIGGAIWDSALGEAVFAFDVMAAFSLLAVFVLMILGEFIAKLKGNKVIAIISLCLLGSYIALAFLARLLEFGAYGEVVKTYHDYGMNDYHYPWYIIMANIADIVLLGAVFFGYILLFTNSSSAQPELAAEAVEEPEELEAEVEEEGHNPAEDEDEDIFIVDEEQ